MTAQTLARTTTLYRMFDEHDALLYVGISHRTFARFSEHAASKPWWQRVAVVKVEHLPDREAALKAEERAIFEEEPEFNQVGAGRRFAEEEQQTPSKWRSGQKFMCPRCEHPKAHRPESHCFGCKVEVIRERREAGVRDPFGLDLE